MDNQDAEYRLSAGWPFQLYKPVIHENSPPSSRSIPLPSWNFHENKTWYRVLLRLFPLARVHTGYIQRATDIGCNLFGAAVSRLSLMQESEFTIPDHLKKAPYSSDLFSFSWMYTCPIFVNQRLCLLSLADINHKILQSSPLRYTIRSKTESVSKARASYAVALNQRAFAVQAHGKCSAGIATPASPGTYHTSLVSPSFVALSPLCCKSW